MKILLTGASGQVGYQLERSLQSLGEVVAVTRAQMDLSDLGQVRDVIRALRPGLVVNAAGYTAVDRAEREPALAYRINAEAPGLLAREAAALGAAMVHYSTDYVFDGRKPGAYVETDAANPLNVYGQSKLAGEQAIAAAGGAHLILRTSWVYGTRGDNFLTTMLRLAAEGAALRVVSDQVGAPTWSRTVADSTALMLAQAHAGGPGWWQQHGGIYHVASGGQTSWHGFAEAIMAEAGIDCAVTPITGDQWPAAAARPRNSVMHCERLAQRFCRLPDWREALRLCLG
ncbi:dTDP-4-dehydrorhamnose reductase [Massilia sp. TWR1-2-2]|uniref:dTDP-4-dehydrorhamnose reductase n=1 Tax=Massilia sp. TWR1-2-2 TaxID=2804584 RepID=UPI003CF1DA17